MPRPGNRQWEPYLSISFEVRMAEAPMAAGDI
jgi:hypothetical protein